MRVKIADPHPTLVGLLECLTETFDSSDEDGFCWQEGWEGEDKSGYFVVLQIVGSDECKERARRAFRNWRRCEVID